MLILHGCWTPPVVVSHEYIFVWFWEERVMCWWHVSRSWFSAEIFWFSVSCWFPVTSCHCVGVVPLLVSQFSAFYREIVVQVTILNLPGWSVGQHCFVWICGLLKGILDSLYGAFCLSITLCKVRAVGLVNKSIASWEVGEFPSWELVAVVRNQCTMYHEYHILKIGFSNELWCLYLTSFQV